MKRKIPLRQKFENNGLIMIAFMMVVIYWIFDVLSSGHYMMRALIAAMIIIYGVFTQMLINSRKAAIEEKDNTQQQLIQAERLAALGALAAGVAHEVKNPLAIVLQDIDFLKSSLYNNARMLDVTNRIEKSVLRAEYIVEGLLSYSREISIKSEEMDIGPVIDETLSYIDRPLSLKEIRVMKWYAPELPMLIMDSNQIIRVFINIFMNAIEAMQEGGILGIRTELVKDETDQAYVKIVVSDTGEGIPGDRIHRIFDPFFTTKNTEVNTGLGLSISKGIIEKHNGSIDIESEPGRGTRVIIELPVGHL
jgi:two-component system, NtrC family, sensor kinase